MLLSYFLLAASVSVDSLGIGITYGLRKTKISKGANCILFILSVIITSFSVVIGNKIAEFVPPIVATLIGSFFLLFMGVWVIYQALEKKEPEELIFLQEPKMHQFFIDFLGITIQIIRDPISSDLDSSHRIDWKEALYLGIALSIDSFGVGICSSIIGYSSFWFPVLVASFQLLFLTGGRWLGERISSTSSIPENIWSVLSGALLICIAISRFFA